jgi:hypothetical protein
VSKYDVSRGVLILEHNYGNSQSLPSSNRRNVVEVDINLLLARLKYTDVQVGAWLNILGYVRHRSALELESELEKIGDKQRRRGGREPLPAIYIDAVMILSAGSIRVGEYERVLTDAQEAERRIRRPA